MIVNVSNSMDLFEFVFQEVGAMCLIELQCKNRSRPMLWNVMAQGWCNAAAALLAAVLPLIA